MAQHHPEQMRTAPFVILDHPGAPAKIDLHLLAWLALHSTKRQRVGAFELAHKPFDRVVAPAKGLIADQILIDPLARQPRLPPFLDPGTPRLALAARALRRFTRTSRLPGGL